MVRWMLPLLLAAACRGQSWPAPVEGDWTATDFVFKTGGKLAELRLHYNTLGAPERDAAGHVRNSILVMHGTGGTGRSFLSPGFAGELFGKGQPLDARRYFIILPDAIGHGKSSKPSDGLRAKFPHYDYEDMVRADYLLLKEGLGVDHLRLITGTSMGGMHTWVWGDRVSGFHGCADAAGERPGRNRRTESHVPRHDHAGHPGRRGIPGRRICQPPLSCLIAAQYALWMMTSSPLQLHKQNPTHDRSDAAVKAIRERAARTDANDMLYYYDSSTTYNPSPHLEKIKATLFAINSADDEVNPPELGILEREIAKVSRGRYILIPTSEETRGHGTHSRAAVWKNYLIELLKLSEPRAAPRNP